MALLAGWSSFYANQACYRHALKKEGIRRIKLPPRVPLFTSSLLPTSVSVFFPIRIVQKINLFYKVASRSLACVNGGTELRDCWRGRQITSEEAARRMERVPPHSPLVICVFGANNPAIARGAQCGPVVRALALRSGVSRVQDIFWIFPLNLFLVVPDSTFQLHLWI